MFVFVVLSFLAEVCLPVRKWMISWLSRVLCFLVFVALSHMCLIHIMTKGEVGTVLHV